MKLGACGIKCESCDCYIATKNNDDALRETLAKNWTSEYDFNFTKEMINCSGCMEEGAKIGHCYECKFRNCAISKNIDNCKYCNEFPCKELDDFHKNVTEARDNLLQS